MPAMTNLVNQAAAVKAQGPQKPGTAARPKAASAPMSQRALPSFMQGAATAAKAAGVPAAPQGNSVAEMLRAQMPQHTTAMLRENPVYHAWGPVVGPRPPQVVTALRGMDGWFDSIKKAVASVVPSHTIVGKLVGGDVAGAVKDTGKLVTSQAKPPAPVIQPTQVEQAWASMRPQNETQKWMLIGAGVLGLGLFALVLRRR